MIFSSRNPITIASIIIVTLLILGAWVISFSISEGKIKNETLVENQKLWARNKPEHYSFVYASGCMFVSRYKVEVNQFGSTVTPLGNSSTTTAIKIEDLFLDVEDANLRAYKVETKYHPNFGFPIEMDVDWEKDVIDDECFIQVTDFKVLNSNET